MQTRERKAISVPTKCTLHTRPADKNVYYNRQILWITNPSTSIPLQSQGKYSHVGTSLVPRLHSTAFLAPCRKALFYTVREKLGSGAWERGYIGTLPHNSKAVFRQYLHIMRLSRCSDCKLTIINIVLHDISIIGHIDYSDLRDKSR